MQRTTGRLLSGWVGILSVAGLGVSLAAGCARIAASWQEEGAPRSPGRVGRPGPGAGAEPGPASTRELVRLGLDRLQEERLGDAQALLESALKRDPDNVEALLGLSALAAGRADLERALALVLRAAQLRPDDAEVLNNLALILVQAGRLQEAARTFERALTLGRQDPTLLLNVASFWAGFARWQAAEDLCRRAMEAAPAAVEPRLMLAYLFFQQGRPERGDAELERLVADHPDSAIAHEALAEAHRLQGRHREALRELDAALRLRPDEARLVIRAGDAHLNLRQWREAERRYQQALGEDPTSAAAQLGLAEALMLQGRRERSIALYEQLADRPSPPLKAVNNLAYLYAESGTRLERALELARQTASEHADNPAVLDTLGWVLYRAGHYPEAVAPLQEALRLAPGQGIIHYHLGRVRLAMERRAEAAVSLRAALARDLPPGIEQEARAALADCEGRPAVTR